MKITIVPSAHKDSVSVSVAVIAQRRALALERGVPVVLDRVVGATVEQPRDCGPLVAEARVGSDDGVVLFGREGTVLHLRRELVAPPQPARLAGPARYRLADQRPVPRPVLLDQILESVVLFGAPRALDPIHPIHFLSGHSHRQNK